MERENLNERSRHPYRIRLIYLSVALISISVLTLEIGLTRIFSVMFDYHYVFLLVSLAVLGLGAGGIYVHTRIEKRPDTRVYEKALPLSSGLTGLSIVGMTILITGVPGLNHVAWVALLTFLPFFFAGVFLSSAFRLVTYKSPWVYASDLIGASLGSILVVFLLKLGGINVNLLVAVIASFPAMLLAYGGSVKKVEKAILILLPAVLLAVFLANYLTDFMGEIPLTRGAHKEMAHLLASPARKARVIESRWSAFGRTDLVADESAPGEMVLFLDGTAGTVMYGFDGDPKSLDKPAFTHFSGFFPFELLKESEKEKVLIIGAGGGREVLLSLLGGVKEIRAVEINRDLVGLVKKHSDFNGGIYKNYPGVKVVVEEGRSFVRRDKEQYDIVMLAIPVTKSGRTPEGFALTENYLFTTESINDYLDRLTPDGRLIVVAHDDMEIFRLIFTSLDALAKRGRDTVSAMKHIYTLGPQYFPVFVLKKSPFSSEEAAKVHSNMHKHQYSAPSTFIPFIEQQQHVIPLSEEVCYSHEMLNEALYLMAQGKALPREVIRAANFETRPVTDDAPFFYKFEVGLPATVILLLVLSALAMTVVWFIGPTLRIQEVFSRNNLLFLLLFSFLGIGFMLVEIPLIQKFILFLGQPLYSMAVLLFSLLIGSGIGSWAGGSCWKGKPLLKLRIASLMVAVLVGIYIFSLGWVFRLSLGMPLYWRALISFVLLFPLGFFMGIPFPMGMLLLEEKMLSQYVPRMWGVNGIGSVLGSTLAIALAVGFGFSYAMLLGAVMYISIFILFSLGSRGAPGRGAVG